MHRHCSEYYHRPHHRLHTRRYPLPLRFIIELSLGGNTPLIGVQ
jgi:hypothetical protein